MMINSISMIGKNFKGINFNGCCKTCDEKAPNIEKRMNEIFGCTIDEFIKVCDDRKFYNKYGMSPQEYLEDEDRFQSPSV